MQQARAVSADVPELRNSSSASSGSVKTGPYKHASDAYIAVQRPRERQSGRVSLENGNSYNWVFQVRPSLFVRPDLLGVFACSLHTGDELVRRRLGAAGGPSLRL